jgi:hypothetical protein
MKIPSRHNPLAGLSEQELHILADQQAIERDLRGAFQGYAECGLCHKLSPIDGNGDFLYPCSRWDYQHNRLKPKDNELSEPDKSGG